MLSLLFSKLHTERFILQRTVGVIKKKPFAFEMMTLKVVAFLTLISRKEAESAFLFLNGHQSWRISEIFSKCFIDCILHVPTSINLESSCHDFSYINLR